MIRLHRSRVYLRTWAGSYVPIGAWRLVLAGHLRGLANRLQLVDRSVLSPRFEVARERGYAGAPLVRVLDMDTGERIATSTSEENAALVCRALNALEP